MKILVAEDDAVARLYLRASVQKLGHEAILCKDGAEALAAYHEHKPFIVISDWMMPGMDGLELCQRIRALSVENYTYFILQTARSSRDDFRVGMESGVDDFLAKPVNQEDLFIRLRVAERIIQQRIDTERRIRVLAKFPADHPNPVLQIDREKRIAYANTACAGLLELWGRKLGDPVPDDLGPLADLEIEAGEPREIQLTCGGRIYSFSRTSVSADGVAYLYGHDVTESKLAEKELIKLKNEAEEHALHDQLTGLPNRRLLTERVHQEIARAQRQNTKLALVIVDIDNFKQINDGYGHKLGDHVIVAVAQSLKRTLRTTDTVCRWGGDEMVLLLTDLTDRSQVGTICRKLRLTTKQDVAHADISAPVSLSLGSALFPDDAQDSTLLMQQADHALYVAKADGRDCWREFRGFPNGHDAKGRADLFLRLSNAVAEGRINAFFQPIISANHRKLAGAEALARWQDEHYGWVSPDVFIPLAEEKGLIIQLGRQVLLRALDQLALWRQNGLDLSVSVNLSKRQLLDADFLPRLVQDVEERCLTPQRIILEITERQSVLGHALSRQRLEELAAAGFRLSIDDFGSGYSSFDLVGETSFSELKIHMGLVRQSHSMRGRRVVQAIVEMARTLNLAVVAEGVEDQIALARLTALGAHKIQGYLFSKPIEAGAFLEYALNFEKRHGQRRAA